MSFLCDSGRGFSFFPLSFLCSKRSSKLFLRWSLGWLTPLQTSLVALSQMNNSNVARLTRRFLDAIRFICDEIEALWHCLNLCFRIKVCDGKLSKGWEQRGSCWEEREGRNCQSSFHFHPPMSFPLSNPNCFSSQSFQSSQKASEVSFQLSLDIGSKYP